LYFVAVLAPAVSIKVMDDYSNDFGLRPSWHFTRFSRDHGFLKKRPLCDEGSQLKGSKEMRLDFCNIKSQLMNN